MAVLLTMPRYGANMEEGTIASWSVAEGERVKAGDVICEIEIEKLSNEMEAPESGVIRAILCPEGETVACGTPIAVLAADEQEDISDMVATTVAAGERREEPSGSTASGPVSSVTPPAGPRPSGSSFPGEVAGIRITPKALVLAEELGVDYRQIRGTGILGAITREDIRAHAASETVPAAVGAEPAAPLPEPVLQGSDAAGSTAPMGAARRVTARRMLASMQGSAQTSIMMDADLTGLVMNYSLLRERYAAEGIKLSYTAIILKAAAESLVGHPVIRTVIEKDDQLRTLHDIDIGIAVDAGYGLVVPVIQNVDHRSLKSICRDLSETAASARAGSLSPEQMHGGCFSISNVGMLNVKYFTPILNAPQSAILGVGTLSQEPRIIDGGLHIRWILSLSLTYDHRVIDGAPAARFLNAIRASLESGNIPE